MSVLPPAPEEHRVPSQREKYMNSGKVNYLVADCRWQHDEGAGEWRRCRIAW